MIRTLPLSEMKGNPIVVLFSLTFSLMLWAPTMRAQRNESLTPLVSGSFDYPLYQESFDSSSGMWPIISNSENLLIIQDGEYILHRKSKLSPFAAMCENNMLFSDFRLVTSMKLVKTANSEGSMGCIFLAQPGGTGGYIFEINLSQKYRLREITPEGYKILTGNEKDGGWVRSSFIRPEGVNNTIDFRISVRNMDIYINNSLLANHSGLSYSVGTIGFIISPGSIGKVDHLTIHSGSPLNTDNEGLDNGMDPDNSQDIATLAGSIAEYKSQLNELKERNEELEQRISTFREAEEEQQRMKTAYESRINVLESQLKKKQKSMDSLQLVNQDLLRYKEMVTGNEGGDVVISLSRNLKAEKLRADELQKNNQTLKDSIGRLNLEIRKQKSGTGSDRSNSPSRGNSFSLPQEN